MRICAAGICGSDLRHYRRQVSNASYPLTAGHERYRLVHREGSPGTYALRLTPSLPAVEIHRRAGTIFENLLGYRRLIQRAAEIHCVNSSVIHLVDSIDPAAALYYHDVRKRNFQTRLSWQTIEYRPRWVHEAAARARRFFAM